MSEASLVVVGSGIKFLSHLTIEAKTHIEQADKVLFLVNDPAMKEWLQRTNPNSESLDFLYTKYPLRIQCYNAITDYILALLKQKQHICVVLYGHPSVFAMPALKAVKKAKQEGFYAKILPGISSEDCLFADLLIDPASHGCVSVEATDLLIHQRKMDTSCHNILWQVSVIGMLQHNKEHNNKPGITLLRDYLKQWYPEEHRCILYSAAMYPGLEPQIQQIKLNELADTTIGRTATLYISPLTRLKYNETILKALNIQLEDLTSTEDSNAIVD